MNSRKALALSVWLPLLAFGQKKPVTLDTILNPPGGGRGGPGAAIWAPDGKTFLFRQGSRIMRYDVAAKSASELLTTESLTATAVKAPPPESPVMEWENRRVQESSIQWSEDGKQLLLEAGGDLFVWSVDARKSDQLTATPAAERDPKFSPDGRRVAFRRGHDLYAIDLASRKETRLTTGGADTLRNGEPDWVYPEELSLGTAYWWSPDSKSIAYLQFDTSREPLYPHADLKGLHAVFEPERYPQAGTPNPDVRLGVVSAEGGPTRWMDTGDTRDKYLIARVAWTPDSKQVTIQRFTRVQDQLELLALNPASGEPRLMLRETDPYWINLLDNVRFLKDGRQFLWSSERDGFRHLYLYSADGRDGRQITKGPWEVTAVAGIDEERQRIYYVSSEASPLERRLYSIRFNGKDKKELTPEAGTHSVSMSPKCDYYLDNFSNLTAPPRTTLNQADGSLWTVYREADRKPTEEYDVRPTEIVPFHGKDGTLFYGRLIKPAGFDPGRKYPAIVMVYGGPTAQSVRNAWPGLNWDQVLAHKGFVIWQMDNRGAAGRGKAFETVVFHKLGIQELADQREGVEHLISMGFVDAARIGIYGWSYGGFMAMNAMVNAPGVFRAGIAGAPVTDWHNYDTIYTERYMGLPSIDVEGYRQTGLAQSAGNLKGALLIVHNYQDDNVLFQNSLQMIDAFERAGKPFELMLYTGKSHGVMGPVRKHLNETLTAFFERNLK